jgi:hypothetical protein
MQTASQLGESGGAEPRSCSELHHRDIGRSLQQPVLKDNGGTAHRVPGSERRNAKDGETPPGVEASLMLSVWLAWEGTGFHSNG